MRAPRYTTRPRLHERQRPYHDDDSSVIETPMTTPTVHVDDASAFTGLYDASGAPLYREKEPFGFRVRD